MGKNKRNQIKFYDSFHDCSVNCDSVEEVDMYSWLLEAHDLGIVIDFKYQPKSYLLSDAVKYVNAEGKQRTLLREHIYSPDFEFTIEPKNCLKLAKELKLSQDQARRDWFKVCVDVKGTFAKSDGGRSFSINQKWLLQKHDVYVCKIVPKDFFKLFGVPKACQLTAKTKKPRKMYLGYPQIDLSLFN